MAARVEAHAHALARRDLRHGGADAFHDARALVAQHGRQGHRIPLVAHDQVGVADACRGHADEHLVGAQVAQLELLQREGRVRALGHRSSDLHRSSPRDRVPATAETREAAPIAARRPDTPGVSIPIILDCDPGHDDAIALLLALASPEVELLGVTTVHGNQTLAKTTANALRVLDLAGRSDIAVAAGAERPLVRELSVASHVHGESGLDGPALPPAKRAPLDEGAVDFMLRTIAASPAPVTLVPTGPLTNIALLLERTGGANVERIVLMGGAIAEGNMTPAAEFNIWADPEAAQAVFHAGIDTTMIGLDVTHRAAHDAGAAGAAAVDGSHRGLRRRSHRVLHRLSPRDVRLGRRADPRCRGRRRGDPTGARHDRRAQRRGRARVRALPRAELSSTAGTGRAGEPNAKVGIDLDSAAFFELLVERIARLG